MYRDERRFRTTTLVSNYKKIRHFGENSRDQHRLSEAHDYRKHDGTI